MTPPPAPSAMLLDPPPPPPFLPSALVRTDGGGGRGGGLEALAEGLSSALGATAGLGQSLDVGALGPAEGGRAFSPFFCLGFCAGARLGSLLAGVDQSVEEQSNKVQDAPNNV